MALRFTPPSGPACGPFPSKCFGSVAASLPAGRLAPTLLLLTLLSTAFNISPLTGQAPPQSHDQPLIQWAWPVDQVDQLGGRFWPQFRGPSGDGIAAIDSRPPLNWGEDAETLVWKLPIAGRAWSSPVIWGDRIYLTNATPDGRQQSVLFVDLDSGRVLLDKVLFENEEPQPDHHVFNSYASPTPVVDAEHLFVHFGAYGTACLNRHTAEPVWVRQDLPCNHFRGPGSSPILFEDLLIFHMDGFDYQYIVALDRYTGETRWRQEREIDYRTDNGDYYKAYSTPMLTMWDEQVQLISPASKATLAYRPQTGEMLWRVSYDEFSGTARPIRHDDLVLLSTGFSRAKMLAVQLGGQGDLTEEHIAWQQDRYVGSKPSPLTHAGLVFNVHDDGIVSCSQAQDGELLWRHRLGGNFTASPVLADGRLYLLDEQGSGYCLAADAEGTILAQQQLDEGCLASPAILESSLIIRTRTHLYRFDRSP